jgi:tight adherence protein B
VTRLPALLAAAAVVVAVGLPAPRRLLARQTDLRGARMYPASVLGLGVAALLVVPLGPVGAIVTGGLSVLAKRAWERRGREHQQQQERRAATEAMAVLAADLRAGRPPGVALSNAAGIACGPTSRALSEAGGATRLGGGAAEVLVSHVPVSAVPELLAGLAVCWQVCHGTGSSLAVAVDRLEEALRADQVCRDEVEAELAGPRATATLLAFLPMVGVLMAAGLGARPVHVLLHTPIGWGLLVGGVGLDLLGVWWTGRIVRMAVRT